MHRKKYSVLQAIKTFNTPEHGLIPPQGIGTAHNDIALRPEKQSDNTPRTAYNDIESI